MFQKVTKQAIMSLIQVHVYMLKMKNVCDPATTDKLKEKYGG